MNSISGGAVGRKAHLIRRDPALSVVCPVCEASRNKRCHVQPGVMRWESHFERIEFATNEMLDTVALSEAIALRREHQSPKDWGIS